MGKSTISMAIFNSFLYVYQAGYPHFIQDMPILPPWWSVPWKVVTAKDRPAQAVVEKARRAKPFPPEDGMCVSMIEN